MFENELVELDADDTLAAAEANEHTLITAETRRLQIAAHWADLHPGDAVPESRLPGSERAAQLGGDGTPTVGDFAPAELGCVLRMSDASAARLIGDALDLRHRLPSIWAAAQAGQVPAYQARRIAHATRHLSAEQAGFVDCQLAPTLGAVSWGRLETLLDAAIHQADPRHAEEEAKAAARERFVRLGRASEHGLKLIIARATAGDAIWFKATIDRIADILGHDGDRDPIEIRRSKAIGILAQPAQALQLLCRHQDDSGDGSEEPADAEAEPASEEITLDEPGDSDEPGDLDEPGDSDEPGDLDEPGDPQDPEQPDPDQPADPPPSTRTPTEAGDTDHHTLRVTPPPFDPVRARPRVIIYVHVAAEALAAGTGITRVENVGPVMLGQLHTLLGDNCSISLKPVIDLPAGHIPLDCYEIPAKLREQLLLRYPADVFPYAAAVSRSIDIDHTIPYLSPDRGGPPGQTRIGNLAPHVRRHHNVKTHGRWHVRQPEPGTWLWRSPHKRIYLVNATGTHPLGDSGYAQTIWHAAANPSPALVS